MIGIEGGDEQRKNTCLVKWKTYQVSLCMALGIIINECRNPYGLQRFNG